MMMYDMTRLYQAERTQTAAERRRADDDRGMLAAAVSRRWQRVTRPARALFGSWTGLRARYAGQ